MKKTNNFISKLPFYILLFFTAIFLQSCELFGDDNDAPPKLPEATQTGKNTFGFKLNGEVVNITNTSKQVAIYQNGGLIIGGQLKENGKLRQVSLFLSETNLGELISENNSYILNSNKVPKGEYYNELDDCFYFTTPSYIGNITITRFDKINYIISGKFNFNAYSDTCLNSIKVTEGRFDLKYIP